MKIFFSENTVDYTTYTFNYALYAGLVTAMPAMPPLVALAVASAAAMAMSWAGYSRLVFARPAHREALTGRDRLS